MLARDIMTESPVCCIPDTSIKEVSRMMLENNCGLVPVVDDLQTQRLVGVITDRDIVCRVLASEAKDCNTATVADGMSAGKLWTVKADDTVDDVIDKMEEGQVRRIPVVDDGGRIEGIISTADIALEVEEPEDIAEVLEEISEPTNLPRA